MKDEQKTNRGRAGRSVSAGLFLLLFLLWGSFFFGACSPKSKEKTKPELAVSHWKFDSEPSCVNILKDGLTVAVGTETGYLYLLRDELLDKTCISLGDRIYKVEYIGEKDDIDIYMISVRHKGLHIVGIDKGNNIRKDITCFYENDELPYKENRYTAYDWFRKEDDTYYFATSNGLWTCPISLEKIDLDKDTLIMQRVGTMGTKKSQYAITSVSYFDGKICFSSQDGFWEFDGIPKRLSADSIKYNSLIHQNDKLIAFNESTIITLFEKGAIKTEPNLYKAKFFIPINDSTTYYFANNKLYVSNRPEVFDLRVTQSAKNTFAVSYDQGTAQGIYMIQGNDLVYVDIQLVMMYNPTVVLGICEEKKDATAYLIDNYWNLYSVSDTKVAMIGQIRNIKEPITEMIVMNDCIYLITDYFLYKVPIKKGISGGIQAEKIDLFEHKTNIDLQTERMVTLYDQDRNGSLIIATRAHLWNLDLSSPISPNNPVRLHIRARTATTDELMNLDDMYESCNVQAIAKYPYKNSTDLLVGTRDFGIITFDKNSINMLQPESWLGLNQESIKNIKSINVLSTERNEKIKILISSDGQIHLITFRTNAPNIVSNKPYFAKNFFFIKEDRALAISEFGGLSLFDLAGDSIRRIGDYYKTIYFKSQYASLKESVLLNSNLGAYLFDKQSHKLSVLDLRSEDSDTIYYISYPLLLLLGLLLLYFIVVRVLRLRKYTALSRRLEEKELSLFGASYQSKPRHLITDSLKNKIKIVTLEELIRRSGLLVKWWEEEYEGANFLNDDILTLIKHQTEASFNFDDRFHELKETNTKYIIYRAIVQELGNSYSGQFNIPLPVHAEADVEIILQHKEEEEFTIDKLIKRMSNLSAWLDTNKRVNLEFKDRIDELLANRLSNRYDFSDNLKSLGTDYTRYTEINDLYALLPPDLKAIEGEHDLEGMATCIIKAIRVIRLETDWLSSAATVYANMAVHEQKLGKGNPNFWQQKQSVFSKYIQDEINAVLKLHPYANWSEPLFEASDYYSDYIANFPSIDMPAQEGTDLEYVIANKATLKSLLEQYYTQRETPRQRERLISGFLIEKKRIEDQLCSAYLKIINLSSVSYRAGNSKLIDYFKNLMTYLYYHLFVIDNKHILNYNEKERRYDSYYDFQQQIIVLSTFLNDTDAIKYDMRPSVLQDKLYLTIEGSDSKENSISKFKDKTKTLHMAFYKKTDWNEYPEFVNLLFELYAPLKKLYGARPKRMG